MRTHAEPLIAAVALVLVVACGPGASGDSGSSSSGSDDSGDGDGDGEETGDRLSCDCTDAEICVADCHTAHLPGVADLVSNFRCVGAQACIELGPHTRECVEAACGSTYGWAQYCGHPGWADLLCDDWPMNSCDEIVQDCADGEKCVVALEGEWPSLPGQCMWVGGTDAPGEPCSSFGNYSDSCTSEAMCWSGELVAEPFEGICQPFCKGTDEQPSCPDDLECVLIAPDFHLCI